ncbi:GDSL-like Lipase/Acylhydrolase [Streptomonospora litoralis]|uniref:GDSL-like Lipase/Acylhydrolase n=1 Tax=Streptomonospora litoralis TaxID=2498135 RepID=A0A4V0ZJA3_9ACTN|nr:GDSL-like Lipase/Acylhydrolase [Streptomonospora litoralis]
MRKGSQGTPPRLRPTPLGLFGITVAAMFLTLLLIQSVMGTFRTADPEGAGETPGPSPVATPPPGTARIMIAGDSIAQGSSGDYTWRYRLWNHLSKRSGLDVEFVGPRDGVFDVVAGEQGAAGYADSGFDTDHASRWGATVTDLAHGVGGQVARHDPHYLLFMAGINDFAHGASVDDALSAVRDAVTTARVAQSGVQVVIGELTPVWGSGSDQAINDRVARFNAALPGLADEMSGGRSPVAVARTASRFSPAEDTWDGTHPNARGELKIAAAFADALAGSLNLGGPYERPLPDVRTGPREAPEVSAEDGDAGVRLSWNQVAGATRYHVLQQRVRPDPDEQVRLPVEVSASREERRPSVVVDRLLAGATYEFVVQPFKGDDGGARSEPVRIAPDDDPPPAPEGVGPGPDGEALTWAEVPSATHYEVWRRPLRCALPDPPAASPSSGAGEGSPAQPGPGDRPAATAPPDSPTPTPECEPRDDEGPQRGGGWHSAAVVNGDTRWPIPDAGTSGWEFSVRAHRDFVRGGYSEPVTVEARE